MVALDFRQRQPPEDRALQIVVRRRRGTLGGARPELERDEIASLRDGVHLGVPGHRRVEHARQEALAVDLVEAGDLRHHLPAGLRGPGEPVALALGARRGRLPGAVDVGRHLAQESIQHLPRLRVLRAVGRPELAVKLVRGEDRAVGVGQPDPLHEFLHPFLVDPLRVLEEPDREDGVRVEVVDDDLRFLVDDEAEGERRRHLLAGRQRDESRAPSVVIEREPAGRGVNRRPLHRPVEGDGVLGEGLETEDLTENEIDLHGDVPAAFASSISLRLTTASR